MRIKRLDKKKKEGKKLYGLDMKTKSSLPRNTRQEGKIKKRKRKKEKKRKKKTFLSKVHKWKLYRNCYAYLTTRKMINIRSALIVMESLKR